jgi:hypothetical protein
MDGSLSTSDVRDECGTIGAGLEPHRSALWLLLRGGSVRNGLIEIAKQRLP